jgi:hypothetical protein
MTKRQKPITRQALEPSGRIKQALELMVLEGHHRNEAAAAVGIKPKSLYNALAKPHVKAFYNRLLDVLRTSARAKNFHRLEAIADGSKNDMARVAAIKTIEALADEAPRHVSLQTPGLQIVVIQGPAPPPQIGNQRVIEVNPLPALPSVPKIEQERED